jgi:hypothetical protein
VDEQLRKDLRAWQTSGDAEAERRYLVARLRRGDLSWGAVECAAYLGDAVCRELLGEDALGFFPPESGLSFFIHDLPIPDHEVGLRASLLVQETFRRSEPWWTAKHDATLEALRAWLDCVCPEHRTALEAAARQLVLGSGRPFDDPLAAWVHHVPGDDPPRCGNLVHRVSNLEAGAAPGRKVQDAFRERLTALLLPWVLVRDVPARWSVCHPPDRCRELEEADRSREEQAAALRAARLGGKDDPERLPVGGPLDPDVARALAASLPRDLQAHDALDKDQARLVVRSYLYAAGWKAARPKNTLDAPSGKRRLRLKGATLDLLLPDGGEWRDKPTLFLRTIPLSRAGEAILRGMRAALDAPAPTKKVKKNKRR